jgi:uncharacterized protein
MSEKAREEEVIRHWIRKAYESLESAQDELDKGRLSFTVNRIYYACFYIVSACLIKRQLRFQKHSGVRSAFHKNFVKQAVVSRESGEFYDEIYEARQRGDYIELITFDEEQVIEWLKKAQEFINALKSFVDSP